MEVKEYINGLQPLQKKIFKQFFAVIQEELPDAKQIISYGMPAFKTAEIVVWLGANKNHIGLYPKSKAMVAFKKELESFKTGKGSIQFPFDNKVPESLIKKIIRFRVQEIQVKIK